MSKSECVVSVTEQPLRSQPRCVGCGGTAVVELLRAPDRFHGRHHLYRLLRCQACTLVWLEDPPTAEEIGQHYGPDYDRAIAMAGEGSPDRWRDRRVVLDQYKQGGAILDLGCSSGSFLQTLQGNGWDLYGIEMSAEVASRAQQRCGANVFVGDILDAPFAPASFDAITCFHVFEHLYQPREVMQKVAEWLKPGGIFYVLVPNIDSAGARIFGSYWYALELPRHLFHYSPTSLTNVARLAGLEVASLGTYREVFIEYSVRYIVDDVLRKLGTERAPMAKREAPSFPRWVVGGVYRRTLGKLLSGLASFAGDGESIHAVFQKGKQTA